MRRRSVFGFGAALLPGVALPSPRPRPRPESSATPTVRLLDSRYRQNMERTVAYLRFVDADRLLHTFRLNYGRPSTAAALGGWEAPTIQLRGHTTGHLLSGLAQAAAHLSDASLADKGAAIVAALAECQSAAATAGFTPGYLSAFPEQVFADLEAGKLPWAPYYTVHKIFAGLLDQHRLLGNTQALQVATGIAAWVAARTDPLTREQMQKVLHVEHGGMNEAFVNLWRVTGDPKHLELARRFDHDEIFDPLAERRDTLSGRHANTDIPKIVGAAALHEVTGEARYRTIATYFWDQVVHHHTYAIGGNSNAEFFGPPDQIASQLGENTCENCNSYNMLKLTWLLHRREPDRTDLLDYYEWTLLNQMLGEQDPDSAHGNVTYYTGLTPGAQRKGKEGLVSDPGSYSSDYGNFSCDHGSGLETHTKFADTVYAVDGDTLSVNQFIPSEVDFRGTTVRLETTYPYDPVVRLRVTGSGPFTLRIRIPAWVSGPALTVNGTAVPVTPGTFAQVRRHWCTGDVAELRLPFATRWLPAPDNPAVRALAYGPLLLAARHGSAAPAVIPTVDPASLSPGSGAAEFTIRINDAAVRLSPFLDVHHERYSVYFALPPAQPAPEVVAAYPLTGGLADRTGRWPAAALAGGAVAGERGIELGGAGGHVVLPAGLVADLTELTVSVHVRIDTIVNSARVFDLGFNPQSYLFLTPRTGNGTARCAMKLSGMATEDFVDAAIPLPAGTWTHVVVTVGAEMRLYVDGVLSGVNPRPLMTPLLLGATQFNYLGRSQNPKNPYLAGAVDDFRLYGRALTPDQLPD